ncbi:hypothetical protein Trydic_g13 [Trypoxylus dichotomus]
MKISCALRSITLTDVMYWVSQAWDLVRVSTIRRSWSEAIDFEDGNDGGEDLPSNELASKLRNGEKIGLGFASLQKILPYVEQQQLEAKPADLLLLNRWRNIATRKRRSNMKQTPIDSYFAVDVRGMKGF